MRNVEAFREGILSYSASQLQTAPVPWQVLQSGWPIFGLLGLVAYKLSRDGAWKDAVCEQPIESFRIRYEDGMPVKGLNCLMAGSFRHFALSVFSNVCHCFSFMSTEDTTPSLNLCNAQLFEEVMLYGKEVPFSRDVENTAVELLQHLQNNRSLRSLFPLGRLHRVPSPGHFFGGVPYRNGQKTDAEELERSRIQ